MADIKDFEKEKIKRDNDSLCEILEFFGSNNCDANRPYLEQQPKRASIKINGLTRRDIKDCMVLGILECKDAQKYPELPRIYVSEKGTLFKDFDSLSESGEGFAESYINPESVTYNDLYGWDLNTIDPIAATQNMACHLERRMGIFPALLDR